MRMYQDAAAKEANKKPSEEKVVDAEFEKE